MFLALGLSVHLSDLGVRDLLEGLTLFVVLAVVIRPIVVAVTLAGVRMTRAEKTFIAFSGLKGAVPVLLAAFAIIGGVPDADRIYGLVFIAVLASVLAQGTLVPFVARWLGIPMHLQDRLPWELSVRVGSEPPARASTASRPVHEPTGWPLPTCRSATTPGSRCSSATATPCNPIPISNYDPTTGC